jgi:hypothetical protein
MNPTPQQLAVAVAVTLLGAAAVVSPTNPVVGNELVIWGSAFGALAAVLSASPMRRAAFSHVIQLNSTLGATGQLTAVVTRATGVGYGGSAYGGAAHGG